MRNIFAGYSCSLCDARYEPDEVQYTCPKDGGNLDVILDVEVINKKYRIEDIASRTELFVALCSIAARG